MLLSVSAMLSLAQGGEEGEMGGRKERWGHRAAQSSGAAAAMPAWAGRAQPQKEQRCWLPRHRGQPSPRRETTEPPASVPRHKLCCYCPHHQRKHCSPVVSLIYSGSPPTEILPVHWGIKNLQHFGPKSISVFWSLSTHRH